MSHPALENLRKYYAGEITLEQMIEMNTKYTPLETYDKPPEVKTAEKIFGSARSFGAERACPKEKDEEGWNY